MRSKRAYILPLAAMLLAALLSACSGGGESEVTEAPSSSEESTVRALNTEPLMTETVENPGWGYRAYSVSVSDETVVTAELDEQSGNVSLTSYNPGEAEVYVHDCFDHKAVIKVKVAEDGAIEHEASPCAEEYIDAADFGVVAGKSASGLPDLTDKLQSAIDHAHSIGGGTVYLYPGFYNIKLISMREGVTLRMYSGYTDASEGLTDALAAKIRKGEVTVLLKTRIMSTDFNDYGRNSACGFTISGGVIDNDRSTQSMLLFGLSEDITIENVIFKDIKNNHVIQITGCKNVTVRNCIFAGFEWGDTFTRETIQIEQTHPGAHSGNYEGAPQRFDYGEIYGCHDVSIESCYFGPSDELPGSHIAIGHHGSAHEPVCEGLRITNNVFDRPSYAAIRFASIVDVEITGNRFIATEDSNKLCSEKDPAFIILYSNTGDITYNNIVNGKKVTKAFAAEQPGSHNIRISQNDFRVSAGSDKRIITVSGTSFIPGVLFKSGVLRQESYDSKPYSFVGYTKCTNYIGNIDFSENKIKYEGKPVSLDTAFRFTAVYGVSFKDNDIELADFSFKRSEDGINGLSKTSCFAGEAAETYKIESRVASQYISLPNADGGRIELTFKIADTSRLIASEGGRLELREDGKGNILVDVIASEGYSFIGWRNGAGELTASGAQSITAPTTLTAIFEKNG